MSEEIPSMTIDSEPVRLCGQSLIFEVDDTLWKNNIYLERSLIDFAELLSESGFSTSDVQTILDGYQVSNLITREYDAFLCAEPDEYLCAHHRSS